MQLADYLLIVGLVALAVEERKILGRIIYLSQGGWGFISSQELKFERIFFHWTGLLQSTLRFPNLVKGMMVRFIPFEHGERGLRAIKIEVLDNDSARND